MVQQPAVHSKMTIFHFELTAVKCVVGSEKSPALNLRVVLSSNDDKECVCRYNDKDIPKLYSSNNNIDPELISPALMVSFYGHFPYFLI